MSYFEPDEEIQEKDEDIEIENNFYENEAAERWADEQAELQLSFYQGL